MKFIYSSLFSVLYLYTVICCISVAIVISILQEKFNFSGCGLFLTNKEKKWSQSPSSCEFLKFSPTFIFLYSFSMFIYYFIPTIKIIRNSPQSYTVWKKPFYVANIFFFILFVINSCLMSAGIVITCNSIESQFPHLSCRNGISSFANRDSKRIIYALLRLLEICFWSSSIAYVIIIGLSSCLIFQRKTFSVTNSTIMLDRF